MTGILYSIFGFLVAIGLLTTVHEFGHFWVARKCGIKVLRFSIGFGTPLVRWHDKLGTEYVIAAIPLGGYVKMLDETEGQVAQNEKHMAFNYKPVGFRMAVIFAGPFFNILFAIVAYWLVFIIGISSIVPILGTVPKGSVADVAGLKRGYEIVSIDNQPTPTWENISVSLMSHLGEPGFVTFEALNRETNQVSKHVADLSSWSVDNVEGNLLKTLGLEPFDPVPPIIGKIMPDMPAAKVGLLAGDTILSADGQSVDTRTQLSRYLRDKAEKLVTLEVIRDGQRLTFTIEPMKKLIDGGEEVGFIGIQYQPQPWPKEMIRVHRFGPIAAIGKALERTKDYTILTIQFLVKMVTGKVSLQHVAGPISIAKYAGQTAHSGLQHFLGFLALVSISLGVLNMLPIPILDGGHFLYCTIELIQGRPLSEKVMEAGRVFGVVFLMSLMMLAVYNDIARL